MGPLIFNTQAPTIMHIDINSCFATIEQQLNPTLRGRPIAVAAYPTASGCILAPSREAKKLGVKTGMRVRDGKKLCPELIILTPHPNAYRQVHLQFRKLISNYTAEFDPKSIDEFVLKLTDYPILRDHTMGEVAKEIKKRIKSDIGEWITVSIGIASNRFLAKVASGLHKPDGLDEITKDNYMTVFSNLKLTDLCGIKTRSAIRLAVMGIYSAADFYNAPLWKLKAAFASVAGYYWYLRLKGYEIDDFDTVRKSFGNSYAFPKPLTTPEEISPILSKLVEKMGFRLREVGYKAKGVHLAISFRDGSFWHQGALAAKILYDSRDFYKEAYRLLLKCPQLKPVRDMSVTAFGLLKADFIQLNLFEDVEKREKLVNSTDKINNRWGNFTISPARMINMDNQIVDRISFGGIRELQYHPL